MQTFMGAAATRDFFHLTDNVEQNVLKISEALAKALDYIPMPDTVVALIKKTWATELKGADGKPLYTAE